MLVLSDTLFPISGYRITEQIYCGGKTLVYRGIREQDQKPVVIKLMRNEYPTFNEIAQFRNQYTITKNLDIAGIIKPLSLENYRNGYALVMEDFGGISLQDWLQQNQDTQGYSLTLSEFFPIAIAITSILEGLHRDRIIHKDIKPANILINPSTLEIRLIDFSIATLLPREIQNFTNPNVLEGTLAYISPEQTGRMNRGIDYRSDFYSLGVTFFELLSGRLPFISNDPIELVYCHIAKQSPILGDRKEIPQVLSDIVMKLMAKNAEDRYQSTYGLKYDLESCYHQWQKTGKIAPFELALKDISDRFLIPEKLYGREQEVATLLAAFERVTRGTTEMVLVTGFSGIGKTAVINEIHKPIIRQQSYFIKGKFDQFQRDIPLSGLVQAFRDLIGQILLENDAQILQWQTQILSALGEQAQVIIDVIPELERIIGKQPPVNELSGIAIQNRFNLLFQRFIQVFNTKSHHLVIFLDDLQWADTASLKFIQYLMCQTNPAKEQTSLLNREIKENVWTPIFDGEPWTVNVAENSDQSEGGLLLICAYRHNEVTQTHPLSLTLQEIAKTGTKINHIDLKPLTQNYLNLLIADTLVCPEEMAIPLSQMVFAKTKGNPFFTTQFLIFLHQEGIIKFNFDLGYWQYNINKIQELALTNDVVEFMTLQIEKLPKMTQNALKMAACIGNEFDLKTLAIVHEKSVVDTASDIWKALHEGIILPQTELYKLFQDGNSLSDVSVGQLAPRLPNRNLQPPKYKFIHDRVQQAAYSLIPKIQRKEIHLKIGQLLLNSIPVAEREAKIFQLVNQLNMAVELIRDQIQRFELAEMNLLAGRKALASTAYTAAFKYLNTGLELLTNNSWETKYELTLALHETAAEAAYLAGDFEQMEQLVQVVLLQAKTLLEKVKVYEIKIQAYTSKNRLLEAIAIAREALDQFGVCFPEQPHESDILQKLAETNALLADKTIDDLTNLPLMTSVNELAIMRIASSMIPPAYIADSLLFPLIILSQINLSVHYGNSPLSAFNYACYGILLNNISQDIKASNEIGRLALNLVEKFNDKDIKTRVYFVIGSFIIHQQSHIKKTLPLFLEGYKNALETGNFDYVGYCGMKFCQHSYFLGQQITDLEKQMQSYCHVLENIQQITTSNYCRIFLQSLISLSDDHDNFYNYSANIDENTLLGNFLEANDIQGIHYFYLNKLILCYLFSNFHDAKENAIKSRFYLAGGTGFITVPVFYFYDSLTALIICLENQFERDKLLKQVADNQLNLYNWAHHAPMNYLHKYYLVEAERYRFTGEYVKAIDYYERSIKLAREHEFIHEEALANELAAKFYLEWNQPKIAQTYLTDAYYGYSRWGAKAKVDDLVKKYPQLLAPIIQQEKSFLHQCESIISHTYKSLPSLSSHHTIIGSQTSISHSLDLASIIKASQALSGEIELEKLLATLMHVVMENAGASKSVLILNDTDTSHLTVTAVSTSSTSMPILTKLPSIYIEHSSDIPINLINYVKRTKEIFVTDNAKTVIFLANDRYILREQPQSLLCIPIINQGKLLGIIYLENNLTTGVFTHDRVEVLKLLTTQGAISLENAILYENLAMANQRLEEQNHTLEKKVAERTQELQEKNQDLQKTLQELQRTQTQLIQSEKMSSLGQLVGGIAHEINNPINFIYGNIDHANEYVQDLLDLIAVYQQEYPHPSNLVKQKASEIDVNFLSQDLVNILASMKVGSLRISNIVLGLRNFSRLDEAEMKPVDIHEGIENTLMLLQHRLTKNSDHPEIRIIKEYSQIPLVNCYVSQLNQVFMNILNNAIDALEEAIFQDSARLTRPHIHIRTELFNLNTLRICIADNGFGIKEEVQQKIFDPFFTTKPVGSGTGLGLSISYQVIVEKHKGRLICNSVSGKGTEFIIEIPIYLSINI